MDWERAKNILLITFLCINIFLGYKIWTSYQSPFLSAMITDEQRAEVKQQLEAHNIVFDGEIPGEVFSTEFLKVSKLPIDARELLHRFDVSTFSSERSEEQTVFVSEDEQLVITQTETGKIEIIFKEAYNQEGELTLSEEKAREEAEELFDLISAPDNLSYYGNVSQNPDTYHLKYYQTFDDTPIFGGQLSVIVTEEGVTSLKGYLLEKEGFMEESMEVIPATMALLRLIDHLDPEESYQISDLTFGYYTEDYLADEWEAVPVWRTEIDQRYTYYINAFTGELEKKEGYN